ncbi:hypothetical protein HYX06_02665 [Candidatus Woesearchaeota archaeon]|nr:hypothetical protein [Candidatus Woesearchaeota archaeon]
MITDTEKVIEGGIFKFSYDEYANKVFAQTPTTNLIIDNGACKSNSVFKVCINRANFSYKNITTYQRYYEIGTDIYKLTGSLDYSSKSALTELLPNEETDFTATITNPTDFEITGIKFSQDLNPFNLREVKGCSVNENSLEWQGSLNPKYDWVCTAKLSSGKQGTYPLTGNLSYFNGYETEKKTLDSVTVKVLPRQLKVIRVFDNYTEINQPFYFNVSLQNLNSEENLEGSLAYGFPGNINIIKIPSGFTKDFNIVKSSLKLSAGSILNFSFYLEPVSEGKSSIFENYKYAVKNVDDIFENSTLISPVDPKPEIDLIAEYQQVNPGQKFIVIVNLKNPSRFYDLTGIKASLNVPSNNEVIQSLSKLSKNQPYTIISNTFIAPEYLESGILRINLVVDYSLDDIQKSINKTLEVKSGSQTPQQSVASQTQLTTNQSGTPTEAQAPAASQQDASSSQSQPESKPAEIIEETLPAKKFSLDFSDRKSWIILGIVFIVIFVVPAIIYSIKKKKRLQEQQPQAPQQQNNIK